MKTLFFGTPALAVPYLILLSKETDLRVVVTTPDEPAGRGYELQPTPVKKAAQELGLPVLQPTTPKDPAFLPELQKFTPELVVVVAYGKLLPAAVLKIPSLGFLNVHFSLLPAYRGAAPIQRALMNGDKRTGVTLFWLDEGMDTGPIFLQKELPVTDQDDAETLREKLVPLGIDALRDVLLQLGKGQVVRQAQSGTPSLAPTLKKEEGKIDWSKSARSILNLIRGTQPWPGAYASRFIEKERKFQRIKILKAKIESHVFGVPSSMKSGQVVGIAPAEGFVVKCGQEFLQILHVQPEGKRPMSAWDFWQGARMKLGDKLG